MAQTQTDSTAAQTFLTKYMRRRALLTLQPNLELYQFGSEAMVPAGEGKHMFAPFYYDKSSAAGSIAESATVTASAMSGHFYSGTLKEYVKAFQHGKFFWGTHSLRTLLEETNDQLTVALAKAYEGAIQGILSGEAVSTEWVAADGETASGSVLEGTAMKARAFSLARKKLRVKHAPGYNSLGGDYAAVIHPIATHHLQTHLSAGVTLTQERASMNMTGGFRRAEVGTLFRCRMFESDYSAINITGTNGMSTNSSGYLNYVFGPEAFFVSPLQGYPPQVFIHGFGSGGTSDPANRKMTQTVYGIFGTFLGDSGNRMVKIPVGFSE